MSDETTTKPISAKPVGGRPTRAQAMLKRIEAAGFDPALVDPRRILAGIAADEEAPASARVAAAKALLSSSKGPAPAEATGDMPDDALSRRALAILVRKERAN